MSDGQLDELIDRRMIEALAPRLQPFRGKISVQELVAEGAPIVLAPAARVKIRDDLRVGRSRWPMLDHGKRNPLSGGGPARRIFRATGRHARPARGSSSLVEEELLREDDDGFASLILEHMLQVDQRLSTFSLPIDPCLEVHT